VSGAPISTLAVLVLSHRMLCLPSVGHPGHPAPVWGSSFSCWLAPASCLSIFFSGPRATGLLGAAGGALLVLMLVLVLMLALVPPPPFPFLSTVGSVGDG
jgi:hypothetical protein